MAYECQRYIPWLLVLLESYIMLVRLRYEEEVHALKQNDDRQNYDRVKELSRCNDTEAFSSF